MACMTHMHLTTGLHLRSRTSLLIGQQQGNMRLPPYEMLICAVSDEQRLRRFVPSLPLVRGVGGVCLHTPHHTQPLSCTHTRGNMPCMHFFPDSTQKHCRGVLLEDWLGQHKFVT